MTTEQFTQLLAKLQEIVDLLRPPIPANTGNTGYGHGYTCPVCGYFVPMGSTHHCSSTPYYPPPQYYPHL